MIFEEIKINLKEMMFLSISSPLEDRSIVYINAFTKDAFVDGLFVSGSYTQLFYFEDGKILPCNYNVEKIGDNRYTISVYNDSGEKLLEFTTDFQSKFVRLI